MRKLRSSLGLSGLLLILPVMAQTQEPSTITAPRVMDLADIPWGPPGGGNGYPEGLRTARRGTDPLSGGITYYALFPAGSRFDRHWHTHDEFVVVAQGPVSITLGEQSHTLDTGAYIVIPGKLSHLWEVPAGNDAIILVRRAGPADFHFTTD